MLKIRLISDSDSISDLTLLLHRAYMRLGDLGLNFTAVDQPDDVTASRILGGICFVATISKTIVGTIVVHPTYTKNDCEYFTRPGIAVVQQFAVEPNQQNLGIGHLLLEKAESWATDSGFIELALDTAEEADHLVKFYAKRGYQPVSRIQRLGKVYRSIVLNKVF